MCPHLFHLLHHLFFFDAYFGFDQKVEHITDKLNVGANTLLGTIFLSLSPQAQLSPW